MYEKAILENDGTLEYVPYWCKIQKTYDEAVGNYAHALEFVPGRIWSWNYHLCQTFGLAQQIEKPKRLKKDISKEWIPVARHPATRWDWYLPENERKGRKKIFTDKVAKS